MEHKKLVNVEWGKIFPVKFVFNLYFSLHFFNLHLNPFQHILYLFFYFETHFLFYAKLRSKLNNSFLIQNYVLNYYIKYY